MGSSALARFDVHEEVGRGASGVVFRAADRESGGMVALKVILADDVDGAERERLRTEGELLCSLEHPNIVRVVDYGDLSEDEVTICGQRFAPQTPFIAMEWLDGADLSRRQSEAPLTLPESIECSRQIAAALTAAHAAGVVHRDVKPTNVFAVASRAESNGDAPLFKLVDFGVAVAEPECLSVVGAMAGTPAYMAPEQARTDGAIDSACDVYSLGATLYELIAGRPPHQGASPVALLAKLVSTPPQRLRELVVNIPDPLDELIADMLQIEADDRPAAWEVGERLATLAEDPDLPTIAAAVDSQDVAALSSVSRLVTTVVVLAGPTGDARLRHLERMRENGAEAVALGGDSLVAFLGARRAHGSEAVQAIEIGRELIEAGASVGVATGRALVDLARPVGDVVDRASALARDASAGELLTDETTAELARTRFEFQPRSGDRHTLIGVVPLRRGGATVTPFVGREDELTRLLNAYDRCIEDSCARVVSVAGPPGIGKTRLAREFMNSLGRAGGVSPRIIQAHCDAYGRARALGTAADMLNDMLSIPRGANSLEVVKRLDDFKLVHDEDGLLASLLAGEPFPQDIAAHRARDILYLAMTELMFKVSRREPCIILLEDLQWADTESVAWFAHLLSRFSSRPLFLVVLARPEFFRAHREAFRGAEHQRVDLRPIGRQATIEIARALTRAAEVDDEKLMQIAVKAAGSPLFAEELARVVAAGKEEVNVPTIEAAIQVSLDALDEGARDALSRLSVLGTAGWDEALGELGAEAAGAAIEALCDAEIIVEQAQSRFAKTREFWFKHALVRDVAYSSVSDALKADLHARAGAWLARAGEDAATVAEHYDLGEEHELAAGFWERAARRALAANALATAVNMADRALTFATEPRTRFMRAMLLDEIHSRLDERSADRSEAIESMASSAYDEACEVRTLGARARYDHACSAGGDVEERLTEAARRSAELGLVDEQARCAATLAARYAFAGQLEQAEHAAEQLLELARQRKLSSVAVDAWQTFAVVRQTRGELASALDARRNAARAARAAGLRNREAMLTINLGFALTTIGAKDEARTEIDAGLAMAEEIGSTGTLRLGKMILLGWAAHFGGEPSLLPVLAESRQTADEAAQGGWITRDRVTLGVLFYRGCELVASGEQADLRRASKLLAIAAEAYRQTDNRDVLPVALGYWAEALRRNGETEEAERIALEAAQLVESGAPSLLNEGIIYIALASAQIDLGDLNGAQATIKRAMPALSRRVQGLRGTPYERQFLTALSHNAALLEAAESYDCVPADLEAILQG